MNALMLLAAACIACGCGSDDVTMRVTPDPVEEGWAAFEAGDEDEALVHFMDAVDQEPDNAEAHLGLGFTLLRLIVLGEAIGHFDQAAALGIESADPHAGRCVAYRDADPVRPELAIAYADSALDIDPYYQFARDRTLDYQDLRLIRAEGYFALGEYDRVAREIQELGGRPLDRRSETFIEDLLLELKRLADELDLQPPGSFYARLRIQSRARGLSERADHLGGS